MTPDLGGFHLWPRVHRDDLGVGSSVQSLSVADRVMVPFNVGCGGPWVRAAEVGVLVAKTLARRSA